MHYEIDGILASITSKAGKPNDDGTKSDPIITVTFTVEPTRDVERLTLRSGDRFFLTLNAEQPSLVESR